MLHQAEEIAKKIPGAVVVTGKTKDRADIIERFTRREIPCIVNVMVFTEGTDIPLVETVIIARPTQSEALYTQMVGRGLRTHPEKEKLILIDCVGVTGKASLCTAPTLIGIDLKDVPASKADQIQGPIFELPQKAIAAADCPESWIRNVQIVDLWAKGMSYNLHDVNYFKMPDGKLICNLIGGKRIVIPCPDQLGRVQYCGEFIPYQAALDRAYRELCDLHDEERRVWDLNIVKQWGKKPATEKQLQCIRRRFKDFDSKSELIASFMGILELIKIGRILFLLEEEDDDITLAVKFRLNPDYVPTEGGSSEFDGDQQSHPETNTEEKEKK